MQHRIVIRRHRPWLRPLLIAAATGGLALGAWALFSFARATTLSDFERTQTEVEQLRAERRQLSRDLRATRAQVEQIKGQLVYAERSTEIDGQACDAVRESISDLQAETSELREQVAFYRGIATPEQARAGVRIQEIRLSKSAQERNGFRFALTLIQATRQEKRLAGRIEMTVVGRSAGIERSLRIDELAPELAQNLLFSLKYFEELTGEFRLPDGFKPRRLVVRLIPSSSAVAQTEEDFEWQRIFDSGAESYEVRE